MNAHDVIVIGLGGMGAAACHQLARRGVRVLGLEQFTLAHDRGSSHGQTRIIRKAYFEHPDYVPLLHRAYDLWDELEREWADVQRKGASFRSERAAPSLAETPARRQSGERLFERCGLLLAGPPDGLLIAGCRRAAAAHNLPLETIAPADLPRRFAGFRAAPELAVLFERDAGFLRVEACVRAHAELAMRHGADLRWNTTVRDWSADPRGVCVRTDAGEFHADRLVICPGPWAASTLNAAAGGAAPNTAAGGGCGPPNRIPLEVRRKVMLWVRSDEPAHRLDRGCSVYGFDTADGFLYGFPADESGVLKLAKHTGGEPVADPASVDRSLHPADSAFLAALARHMPALQPDVVAHAVCMYTMTPDEHFVIDRMPDAPAVVFAAGFSGHGFKFAPLVGSILADLACDGRTRAPIGFLSASRAALAV